ncbi:hypothetical protein HYU18_04635 [Candidatus Woesearchaeota archaeon]|nr:hypothetical protein [Candidatus Woesearchaeota archaeon]
MMKVTLQGWQTHKNNPDARVRKRFEREAADLKDKWAGAVWATRQWYRKDAAMRKKMDNLLNDICKEFGLRARLAAPLIGRYVLHAITKEAQQLEAGWTYEPKTIYRKNLQALSAKQDNPAKPISLPVLSPEITAA